MYDGFVSTKRAVFGERSESMVAYIVPFRMLEIESFSYARSEHVYRTDVVIGTAEVATNLCF